ncbi:MAG TPA: hypothetical protein VMN78_13640 [Longimicrobiales bacterium]|nr:hypothetical protein [Longimicrobiales bacterium]
MRKCILALALVPLLAACEAQPTAPYPDGLPTGSATPQFNWTNNPDVGNLRVYRWESHYAVCWTDDFGGPVGLRACHSTVPLGGGTEPDCGPQEFLDPINGQDVVLLDPTDPEVVRVLMGTLWITVRDQDQPGECFGSALVAEGLGELYGTDNDLFGVDEDDVSANAWGWNANGELVTPEGEEVRYSGHFRFQFNNQTGIIRASASVNIS